MAHQTRRHRRFANAEDDCQNNDSNDDVSVHSSQEDDTESNSRNIDANIRNYTRNQSTSSRVTWNGHMLTSMGDSTRLGSSLQGTNLSTMMTNKHYRTVVGIEITNWTKYHLTSPEVNIYSGYISMPPVSVRPGQKEGMHTTKVIQIDEIIVSRLNHFDFTTADQSFHMIVYNEMIAHKHGYTMTGSSGIVSWLLEKREKRVVIVWGSPFIASNTMAVGLTTAGKDNHESSWFNTITQGKSDANLRYEPFTYDNAIKEIIIEDKDFQICGSMGTSHKPEVKITVRPTKRMDLSIDGLQ